MAQITITIPDAKVPEVREAFKATYNYQAIIANPSFDPNLPIDPVTNPETIDNPETEGQFFQRKIREWIRDVVKAYQAKVAANTARDNAINTFDLDLS